MTLAFPNIGPGLNHGIGSTPDLGVGPSLDIVPGGGHDLGPTHLHDIGLGGPPDIGLGGHTELGLEGDIDLALGSATNFGLEATHDLDLSPAQDLGTNLDLPFGASEPLVLEPSHVHHETSCETVVTPATETACHIEQEEVCTTQVDKVVETTTVEECEDLVTRTCEQVAEQVHRSSDIVGQDTAIIRQPPLYPGDEWSGYAGHVLRSRSKRSPAVLTQIQTVRNPPVCRTLIQKRCQPVDSQTEHDVPRQICHTVDREVCVPVEVGLPQQVCQQTTVEHVEPVTHVVEHVQHVEPVTHVVEHVEPLTHVVEHVEHVEHVERVEPPISHVGALVEAVPQAVPIPQAVDLRHSNFESQIFNSPGGLGVAPKLNIMDIPTH